MFQIRHEPSSGCTQSENPRSDHCPESFFTGSPAATWTVRVFLMIFPFMGKCSCATPWFKYVCIQASPLSFKVNTMPLQHYRVFMIVREIVITEIPVKSCKITWQSLWSSKCFKACAFEKRGAGTLQLPGQGWSCVSATG